MKEKEFRCEKGKLVSIGHLTKKQIKFCTDCNYFITAKCPIFAKKIKPKFEVI